MNRAESASETKASKYLKNKLNTCFEPGHHKKREEYVKLQEDPDAVPDKEIQALTTLRCALELADAEVTAPPAGKAKLQFKRRNTDSINLKRASVVVFPSHSSKQEYVQSKHIFSKDELLTAQGCLKLSLAPRERSYSNAKRYFEYKDSGYSECLICPF